MKVAIIGAGGVGGYFGGRLISSGANVTFIARGLHLEALRRDGLEVRSVIGDVVCPEVTGTDDAALVGPSDIVLMCVKSHATAEAAQDYLPHLIGEQTAVISLQNGLGNIEAIAEVAGEAHTVGGLALIFAKILRPGVIVHSAGPAAMVFGELNGSTSRRLDQFLSLCTDAGIDASISLSIRAAMWDKLAFICAQAGATAATRLPIGRIRDSPPSWRMFRSLVEEVYTVAGATGLQVAQGAVEARLNFAESLEPNAFSSLYDDFAQGGPTEVEAILGSLVRLASVHGVKVPTATTLYAVLHPWSNPAAHQRHRFAVGPRD